MKSCHTSTRTNSPARTASYYSLQSHCFTTTPGCSSIEPLPDGKSLQTSVESCYCPVSASSLALGPRLAWRAMLRRQFVIASSHRGNALRQIRRANRPRDLGHERAPEYRCRKALGIRAAGRGGDVLLQTLE